MAKKFRITYKCLNILFGDNVFTQILEGDTAEQALSYYALDNNYVLKMIEAEEVTEQA